MISTPGPSDTETMHRIVVLRHGILLNRFFMVPMQRFFEKRGYVVYNRSYPSTRKYIEDHAKDLADELRALKSELELRGTPYELYAVTHSLGGLILRYALTHCDAPAPKRAVLMVPPNRGAETARRLCKFPPYRWIAGRKSAKQLTEEPPGIFEACGIPSATQIGVIAGQVRFRLLPTHLQKPNDGVVSVAEAQLEPLALRVLPYSHTPILFVRRAMEEADHFLKCGEFRDSKKGRAYSTVDT